MERTMTSSTNIRKTVSPTIMTDREGFAMVTALLVVLVLSVLAVGATWLATTEKKTTVAESAHMRSIFAADAGGEAAINFVRTAEDPPTVIDWASQSVQSQDSTTLSGSVAYGYDVQFSGWRTKPGVGA
jgi:Tfp pilus assembly protein PilX